MRQEAGFTLIELVVVIVILGILAAFAVPRFVGMQDEARRSTVKGLKGSIQGAASLAHGKVLANSTYNPGTSINIQGKKIAMSGTWPEASSDGIKNMIQDLSGYQEKNNCDNGTLSGLTSCIGFSPSGASTTSCYVEYAVNSSGDFPLVALNATDCR